MHSGPLANGGNTADFLLHYPGAAVAAKSAATTSNVFLSNNNNNSAAIKSPKFSFQTHGQQQLNKKIRLPVEQILNEHSSKQRSESSSLSVSGNFSIAPSAASSADVANESGGVGSPKQQQLQLILFIRMLMQGKDVGSIIGRKGEYVRQIREKSGAKINISDGACPERIVTISGNSNAIYEAFAMIARKFEDDLRASLGDATIPPITLRLIIPASQCGSLIGKGGTKIREIRDKTGASLQVASEMLSNSTEKPVTISGSCEALIGCMREVCQILLDSPAKGPTIAYKPTGSITSSSAYNPLALAAAAAAVAAQTAKGSGTTKMSVAQNITSATFPPLFSPSFAAQWQLQQQQQQQQTAQQQQLLAAAAAMQPASSSSSIPVNPLLLPQSIQEQLVHLLQQQQQQQHPHQNNKPVDVSRFLLPAPIYSPATTTLPIVSASGIGSSNAPSTALLMNPAMLNQNLHQQAAALGLYKFEHQDGMELLGVSPIAAALLAQQQQQQNGSPNIDYTTTALLAHQQLQTQQQQQHQNLQQQHQQQFQHSTDSLKQQQQNQQQFLLQQQQQHQLQLQQILLYQQQQQHQQQNAQQSTSTEATRHADGTVSSASVSLPTDSMVLAAAIASNNSSNNGTSKKKKRYTPY